MGFDQSIHVYVVMGTTKNAPLIAARRDGKGALLHLFNEKMAVGECK
jgi:hypothetical protein